MIVLKLTDIEEATVQLVLGPGMRIYSTLDPECREGAMIAGLPDGYAMNVRETPEEIWAALDDYSSHPPSEVTPVDVGARTAYHAARSRFSATLSKSVETESEETP